MTRRLYIVVVLFFVSGCASVEKMPLQPGINISEVSVQRDISTPDDIYYVGSGLGFGVLFGAVGGAIAGANSASDADSLKEFVVKNDADFSRQCDTGLIMQLNA